MMRSLLAVAVLAAGCWRSPTPPPVLSNGGRDTETTRWLMTPRGVGAIDESAVATQQALQQRLPGVRVVTTDLGGESGIVYDVYDGSERLMYVVPDDEPGYVDGEEHRYAQTVFAVFAVSPRVRVQGRDWRVGGALTEVGRIDHCECWGGGEVTACFEIGTRLRVIFEEPCADAERDGVAAMVGKRIARVMWKRVLETRGMVE